MKVLVTGSRGYVGTPLCRELKKRGHQVIGVDNFSRAKWVSKCTGECAYQVDLDQYINGDVADLDFMREIFQIHQPEYIIHLASQPSMPYSQINAERAQFTQVNNLKMCLNLLWLIKEINPKIKLVVTTTTGIPGQHYQAIPEAPTLNMAGSWYHISRGFDSENCQLAVRQWGLDVLELRTAIVYGCADGSRFDTDFYFGTALNRFIEQAVKGQPLTIYGKGEQTKPFISLSDTVESLANSIDHQWQGYEVMNQTTQNCSIIDIARAIQSALPSTTITHIPNPRKENEEFQMIFDNRKFLKLLNREPTKIEVEIENMIAWVGGGGTGGYKSL